jgi:hypothetical protein
MKSVTRSAADFPPMIIACASPCLRDLSCVALLGGHYRLWIRVWQSLNCVVLRTASLHSQWLRLLPLNPAPVSPQDPRDGRYSTLATILVIRCVTLLIPKPNHGFYGPLRMRSAFRDYCLRNPITATLQSIQTSFLANLPFNLHMSRELHEKHPRSLGACETLCGVDAWPSPNFGHLGQTYFAPSESLGDSRSTA